MRRSVKVLTSLLLAALFAAAPLAVPETGFPEMSITAEAASKLSAPANVKAETTANSITLKWDAVKGADGYKVYMYDEKEEKFVKYKTTSSTSCKVTDLSKNKKYYFKIATLTQSGSKVTEHESTKKISATTKSSDYPAPPSANYTGFATVGGKKYYYENGKIVVGKTKKIGDKIYLFSNSGALLTNGIYTVNDNKYSVDKNGAVACNQWVGQKKTENQYDYYYAEKTGKITTYSIYKKVSSSVISIPVCNLYVDGIKANESMLPKGASILGNYYKINNDYYFIESYNMVTVNSVTNKYLGGFSSTALYDIGSKKSYGDFYGMLNADKMGKCSGKLFNSTDNCVYYFDGKGGQLTKSAANSLVITQKKVEKNSVGGVDYTISAYNNSSKDIKYIYFNVYVKNAVGDTVSCDITHKKSFYLKVTGPFKAHTADIFGWDAFMYNYSAKDVVISSAEIEYMDGTKSTISGNKITVL
ncbi:MAG: fibronectin type III domain-containing protein [Oscillospiraceae bacterium]|nr:fibronectin type III domain-containing protein [Oscillospiraceae bacterium]